MAFRGKKKIIFPYMRVTGFSRDTLGYMASNPRQLHKAAGSPKNTSHVEARGHVAGPTITHDRVQEGPLWGGFQPHPRQRPHNFLVPKWG